MYVDMLANTVRPGCRSDAPDSRIVRFSRCPAPARDVLGEQAVKLARGTMPIEIGTLVGPYEVRSLIGAGGMGVVYEACPAGGQTTVALKVLHPQRLEDDRAIRRLRDEAHAGRIVHHANLAATLDSGDIDGIPFLVMERVCGEPLGVRIQRDGAMSLRRAVSIAQQLLAGLGALHSAGVVHGDVKSDNVLVERQDDGSDAARLIDFGLAHVAFDARDVRRPEPDEELVSGTPEYMAPEVVRGEGSTAASDLYAVGVILYELITGSTPFAGGAPSEIVQRHLSDAVVPPSLRCDHQVPAILERVVMRALEKDPEHRFPSAEAFGAALAVTMPLLDDVVGQRITQQFSREAPTLDWRPDLRSRVVRGTPPRHRKAQVIRRHKHR
jgi:eukaryotic-like serine/threonine-protein kinase